jgi:predicted NAD-dependent protein-ADP-ribosyltransferase YbiA (DUF1768 family)
MDFQTKMAPPLFQNDPSRNPTEYNFATYEEYVVFKSTHRVYGHFSNFHKPIDRPIEHMGFKVPTTEHVYQGIVAFVMGDYNVAKLYLQPKGEFLTPQTIKRDSSDYKYGYTYLDRTDILRKLTPFLFTIMGSIQYAKYEIPGLAKLLIATEGKGLVEGVADNFWGTVDSRSFEAMLQNGSLQRQGTMNVMGQLLEQIRDHLTGKSGTLSGEEET